ncbi:MAG: hypothetical protein IJB80_02530 [Clostridia bacterium]|nr:hypothetical protein [Clostridia bacterium]
MKLLSFGEILWDVYPASQHLGGAPLNLAAHAVLQGCEAWTVSAVGQDALGEKACAEVEMFEVHSEYIYRHPQKDTGRCMVTLDEKGVPSYNLLTDVAYDFIPAPVIHEEDQFDVLAFGTLALREEYNRETIRTMIEKKCCQQIYSDLNIRAPFYSKESILFCLQNATILKVSDEELPIVTMAVFHKEMGFQEAIPCIADTFEQIKLILVTRGEKGACCYDCEKKVLISCDAEPTEVVSTVGAGDSFGATFLATYFQGKPIQECLETAAKVSAFVVAHKEAIPTETKQWLRMYKIV